MWKARDFIFYPRQPIVLDVKQFIIIDISYFYLHPRNLNFNEIESASQLNQCCHIIPADCLNPLIPMVLRCLHRVNGVKRNSNQNVEFIKEKERKRFLNTKVCLLCCVLNKHKQILLSFDPFFFKNIVWLKREKLIISLVNNLLRRITLQRINCYPSLSPALNSFYDSNRQHERYCPFYRHIFFSLFSSRRFILAFIRNIIKKK